MIDYPNDNLPDCWPEGIEWLNDPLTPEDLRDEAARPRFEDPAQLTQEQADAIDEAAKREPSKIKGKQLPRREQASD